jgi:hypothetical protein
MRLLDRKSNDLTKQHTIMEYDSIDETRLEDCTVDNQQERQLAHETERHQQVERSKAAKACKHNRVAQYIETGTRSLLQQNNQACLRSLRQLQCLGDYEETERFDNCFRRLVCQPRLSHRRTRSTCHLSSSEHNKLLLISQYEANKLVTQIKTSTKVRLRTECRATLSSGLPLTDNKTSGLESCLLSSCIISPVCATGFNRKRPARNFNHRQYCFTDPSRLLAHIHCVSCINTANW